ncbi:unnamed protein product [Closterium sp. NIES-54]
MLLADPGAAGVLLADPGAAGVLLADPGTAGVLLADPGAAGVLLADPGAAGLVVVRVDPGAAGVLLVDPGAAGVLLADPGAAGVLLADPGAAGVLLADPGAAGVLLADPGAAGVLERRRRGALERGSTGACRGPQQRLGRTAAVRGRSKRWDDARPAATRLPPTRPADHRLCSRRALQARRRGGKKAALQQRCSVVWNGRMRHEEEADTSGKEAWRQGGGTSAEV